MFGFGKQKYQIIVIDPKTKQRTVVGEETDPQQAIAHVKRLRGEERGSLSTLASIASRRVSSSTSCAGRHRVASRLSR